MAAWWNDMTLFQQILACMAIPATLILIIQTVMLIFGLGGGSDADASDADGIDYDATDADADGIDYDAMDADVDAEGDDGDAPDTRLDGDGASLRIFTVRGMVAFFAVGGWLGLVLSKGGLASVLVALLALLGGCAAMFLMAVVLRWSLTLQESGNITLSNALFQQAQVYLTVPPNRTGAGKVTLTLQERFLELEAVTDADEPLKTGESVRVTGIIDETLLLVSPNETPKTVIRLQL